MQSLDGTAVKKKKKKKMVKMQMKKKRDPAEELAARFRKWYAKQEGEGKGAPQKIKRLIHNRLTQPGPCKTSPCSKPYLLR